MKNLAFLALSAAVLSSSGAFAQSSAQPTQITVASATSQSVAASTTNVQQIGSAAPLRREQVIQELMAAQKDGSLARLNREFYSGGG